MTINNKYSNLNKCNQYPGIIMQIQIIIMKQCLYNQFRTRTYKPLRVKTYKQHKAKLLNKMIFQIKIKKQNKISLNDIK